MVTISYTGSDLLLATEIMSLDGKLVHIEHNDGTPTFEFDVNDLANGIYITKGYTSKGETVLNKFIVQN